MGILPFSIERLNSKVPHRDVARQRLGDFLCMKSPISRASLTSIDFDVYICYPYAGMRFCALFIDNFMIENKRASLLGGSQRERQINYEYAKRID